MAAAFCKFVRELPEFTNNETDVTNAIYAALAKKEGFISARIRETAELTDFGDEVQQLISECNVAGLRTWFENASLEQRQHHVDHIGILVSSLHKRALEIAESRSENPKRDREEERTAGILPASEAYRLAKTVAAIPMYELLLDVKSNFNIVFAKKSFNIECNPASTTLYDAYTDAHRPLSDTRLSTFLAARPDWIPIQKAFSATLGARRALETFATVDKAHLFKNAVPEHWTVWPTFLSTHVQAMLLAYAASNASCLPPETWSFHDLAVLLTAALRPGSSTSVADLCRASAERLRAVIANDEAAKPDSGYVLINDNGSSFGFQQSPAQRQAYLKIAADASLRPKKGDKVCFGCLQKVELTGHEASACPFAAFTLSAQDLANFTGVVAMIPKRT